MLHKKGRISGLFTVGLLLINARTYGPAAYAC